MTAMATANGGARITAEVALKLHEVLRVIFERDDLAAAELADVRRADVQHGGHLRRSDRAQLGEVTERASEAELPAAAVSASARVAVATQTLEATRAQLALVDAQLANLDLQLARTDVKAPFAGQITARNAQLGAIASASGKPMFTLIRDGALELRADVAEGDLARLTPGLTASLNLVSGATADGATVRLVEPSIDPVTRLGHIRITLSDTAQIRAGMFAEASVLVSETKAAAVPVTAVSNRNGITTVMVVEAGIVREQPVTTGIRDGAWVEISQGLTAGQTVVTKAGAFVRDGDHIAPIAASN